MDAQAITEGIAVFLGCITAANLFLNFLQLLVEEHKKCSIMDGDGVSEMQNTSAVQKKSRFRLRKKRQYAVLTLSDRTA